MIGRLRLIGLALLAASWVSCTVIVSVPADAERRFKKSPKKSNPGAAVTTDEKLAELIRLQMTSAEIALATGCSVRAIEDRRRKLHEQKQTDQPGRHAKADAGIDGLYSLASLLEAQYMIPPQNVRAWFIGRSAYLQEQRPASLLGAGEFEIVREAAIAYATGETPGEFLARVGTIARVPDPLEA